MDGIAGANMWEVGGYMDYGDRRETFSASFPFFPTSTNYRDGWGYLFLTTNRLSNQILAFKETFESSKSTQHIADGNNKISMRTILT